MKTRYKRLMFCGGYDNVISLWLYQDYSLVFLHPSPVLYCHPIKKVIQLIYFDRRYSLKKIFNLQILIIFYAGTSRTTNHWLWGGGGGGNIYKFAGSTIRFSLRSNTTRKYTLIYKRTLDIIDCELIWYKRCNSHYSL